MKSKVSILLSYFPNFCKILLIVLDIIQLSIDVENFLGCQHDLDDLCKHLGRDKCDDESVQKVCPKLCGTCEGLYNERE